MPSPEISIVNNHNEAFTIWRKANIKGATLLHVDAHHDMTDNANSGEQNLGTRYANTLTIANFICAAIHYGLVERVYWINPHIKEKPLRYLGAYSDSNRSLATALDQYGSGKIKWAYPKKDWTSDDWVISTHDLKLEGPTILDIDLDGFCCHRHIHGIERSDYDGVQGYQERIDTTFEELGKLSRTPDCINIATSQAEGDPSAMCFVPTNHIPLLLKNVKDAIYRLYGR